MTQVYSFVQRLLTTFLTGFAIATGVSFFIFPSTSREIVGKQTAGFLKLTSATLSAHKAYLFSIHHMKSEGAEGTDANLTSSKEAQTMKKLMFELGALYGKIDLEMGFAKREAAYGKLKPKDLKKMAILARRILLPVAGMTTFIDIIESVKKHKKGNANFVGSEETAAVVHQLQTEEWDTAMANSRESYSQLVEAMQAGLQHIAYTLELEKRPKKEKDVEEKGETPNPGDSEYVNHLEQRLHEFAEQRKITLQDWCKGNGIEVPTTFWDDPDHTISVKDMKPTQQDLHKRNSQQQLYLVLYIEYLTWSTAKSIVSMIRWADSKVEDGTMQKKKFIIPSASRFRKWIMNVFAADADEPDEGYGFGMPENSQVFAGESYRKRKDPEHLPPATFYQKATNPFRLIPKFLGSDASTFGFRVAVAAMSLAILNYLEATQAFFVRQRGIWAVIMTAISMGSHAGEGIFGYILRIVGTTIAMCTSLIFYYMGDKKPAAVLPLMYIFSIPFFYIVVKFPQYAVAGIISMVTPILIIGYELQVQKLGLQVATSNGQPAYPIYELAPYRLATVCAGLGVAFIWTYFPYPITTRLTLRKEIGAAIYLLANYYSAVHATTKLRLNQGVKAEDEDIKGTEAYELQQARYKIFSKLTVLLSSVQANSNLTKLEPTFGGIFPKKTYDDLILSLRHIFNYTSLISYATNTFVTSSTTTESQWLNDFRHFASDIDLLSHNITSTLCLLSASIENEHPLPPYLHPPQSINLDQRIQAIDPDILSVRHISEPCYAAFAVLQVASSLVTEELANSIRLITELVGEVDFSFHVVSRGKKSEEDSGNSSSVSIGDGSTVVGAGGAGEKKGRKKD